jgi:HEAT repeat protein
LLWDDFIHCLNRLPGEIGYSTSHHQETDVVIGYVTTWWRNWRTEAQRGRFVRQCGAPDPAQRQEAAAALAAFRDPQTAAALVALLNDSHTAVREAATASLRGHGPAALAALLEGLKSPSADVAAASATLLGELGDPAAAEPLLVAMKFSERPVQLAAKRALIRTGAAAAGALRAAADDPSPWLRQQFGELLEQLVGKPGPG